MIPNPREAVRAQVLHQEETIKKCLRHVQDEVTKHLNKYPEDAEGYTISVYMGDKEHKHFPFCWKADEGHGGDLEGKLRSALESSGWKVAQLEPTEQGNINIQLQLGDENERPELEKLAEEAKQSYHKQEKHKNMAR